MGSFGVVMLPPILNDDADFASIQQLFPIQKFIAETAIKALNVAVLPRATRLDVKGLDLIFAEPSLDFSDDKLRAVIASNVLGDAVGHHRLPERS